MLQRIICLFVFCACLHLSSACNGYQLKLKKAKNCGTNDVLVLSDIDATLDKDCNVIPKGCVTTKGFQTAVASYKAIKAPLPPFIGEIDACTALKEHADQIEVFLNIFSLPKSCPVPEGKLCSEDKVFNIAKYKGKLGLAMGKIDVHVNITHDTGTTCMEFLVEVTKGKKG